MEWKLNIFIITFLVNFLDKVSWAESYKILVFSSTMTGSHIISNARVADTLAKDGHDVTLLEVHYFEDPYSLNASKNAKVVKVKGPFINTEYSLAEIVSGQAFNPYSIFHAYNVMAEFQIMINQACEKFLDSSTALIEALKAEKFDLYIGEQITLCGTGLSHVLGIPSHILLSSCPIQDHVASFLSLPFPSNYVPSVYEVSLSDKMSILERIRNMMHIYAGTVTYNYFGSELLTEVFRRKYGSDFPHLFDIAKNSPLVFVSVDEFIEFPRPLFPNIIYIGGLEQTTAKSLAEPYISEMEKGKSGVVLFSFGSAVSTRFLDKRFMVNLFATFEKLSDYHFIVKIDQKDEESMEIGQKIPNVFITSWAPQVDLLAHPRLKLFIGHGGYNSLLEVARNAIPVITMGFFADQKRNGRVVERNGWGITFDKKLLIHGHTEFQAIILKVLSDPIYKEKAKRTSKLLLTKPFSAAERLTKNIRFLEANGGKFPELLSESRNLSTFVLYNLDIATLAIILLISLMIFVYLVIRFIKRSTSKLFASFSKRKND